MAEDTPSAALPVKVKRKKTELEKRLTVAEAEALVASITPETHKSYWRRNRAIIVFLLNTGLRVAELAGLKISDVMTVSGKVRTVLGVRAEIAKRQKPRQVPLNSLAQGAVVDLLQNRPEPVFTDALVVTPKGKPLSIRMIQHLVAKAALQAGIERLVSPHMLRHSCLSRLYEKTTNLKLVSVVAGHSKVQLTADLYVHPTLDGMAEAMKLLEDEGSGGKAS